ncbi:hypothetical protein ABK040_005333 [Willaertia magna]
MHIHEVQYKNTGPGPICYHSSCTIGNKMYVLLGMKPMGRSHLDVYVFNMTTKIWEKIEPLGTPPSPRCLCGSVVVDKKIYIFGGYQVHLHTQHTVFNGLFVFDTETNEWSHIETNGICPDPRAGMAMFYYKEKIYIYGGSQGKQILFGDLYQYDIQKNEWRVIETRGRRGTGNFSNAFDNDNGDEENSGNRPLFICCHSANVINNMLYVFGGLTSNAEYQNVCPSNVMYILNLDTFKWKRDHYSKDNHIIPNPRCCHSMIALDPCLIMAGGGNIITKTDYDSHIYMFHCLEKRWYRLTDYFFGSHLPKVVGSSISFNKETNELFFFGGKDSDGILGQHFYSVNCNDVKLLKEKVYAVEFKEEDLIYNNMDSSINNNNNNGNEEKKEEVIVNNKPKYCNKKKDLVIKIDKNSIQGRNRRNSVDSPLFSNIHKNATNNSPVISNISSTSGNFHSSRENNNMLLESDDEDEYDEAIEYASSPYIKPNQRSLLNSSKGKRDRRKSLDHHSDNPFSAITNFFKNL